MVTEQMLAGPLELCQSKRKAIQAMQEVLTSWDTCLEQEERELEAVSRFAHVAGTFEKMFRDAQQGFPGFQPNSVASTRPVRRRRRSKGRKSDVQIIEDIFRGHGPMHVTELVPLGQALGVTFAGKKKPSVMARDKMVGCKKFRLFGNNVWGLPNQELPQQPPSNDELPDTDDDERFTPERVGIPIRLAG